MKYPMKLKQAQRIVEDGARLEAKLSTLEDTRKVLADERDHYDNCTKSLDDYVNGALRLVLDQADKETLAVASRQADELAALKRAHAAENARVDEAYANAVTQHREHRQKLDARIVGKPVLMAKLIDTEKALETLTRERDKLAPTLEAAKKMCAEIEARDKSRVAAETEQRQMRDEIIKRHEEIRKTSPIVLSLPKAMSDPRPATNRRKHRI